MYRFCQQANGFRSGKESYLSFDAWSVQSNESFSGYASYEEIQNDSNSQIQTEWGVEASFNSLEIWSRSKDPIADVGSNRQAIFGNFASIFVHRSFIGDWDIAVHDMGI